MGTDIEVRKETSLTKKQEAKLALFKSKGIENLVHTHELIPMGDRKYKLVAHKDMTQSFDNINGSHSNSSFSYASRMMGGATRMTDDEQKLFFLNGGSDCTVEAKETVPVGSCC